MNWMPEGMRRDTVTKQNAPKPKKKIKDLFDLNGTTPYKTEEIVPGFQKLKSLVLLHLKPNLIRSMH